jgi:hypothetical protein
MGIKRDLLCELGLEDSVVFESPDYENAIIGWDENSGRIIYDYEKMVECLMNEDGMEYDEAAEFIDYNTVRACPYMGERAPIILKNIEDYL